MEAKQWKIITGLIEIEPECSLNYEILGAIERRSGNIKRAINLTEGSKFETRKSRNTL